MKKVLMAALAALSVVAWTAPAAFAQNHDRGGRYERGDRGGERGGRAERRGERRGEGQARRNRAPDQRDVAQQPQRFDRHQAADVVRRGGPDRAAVEAQNRQLTRDVQRQAAARVAQRDGGDRLRGGRGEARRSDGQRNWSDNNRAQYQGRGRGGGDNQNWDQNNRHRGQANGGRDGRNWANNDRGQYQGRGRGGGDNRNWNQNNNNRGQWDGRGRDNRNFANNNRGQWDGRRGDDRNRDWGRDDRGRGDRGGRDWGRDGRRDWSDNAHWRREWDRGRHDHRYRPYWNTHRDFDRPRYSDWRRVRHGYYFDTGYARIVGGYYGRNYYWWSYDGWRRPYRRWSVGYVIPAWLYWEPVPWDLYYRLPPAPYGCRYVYADGDILLVAIATGVILDALLYY